MAKKTSRIITTAFIITIIGLVKARPEIGIAQRPEYYDTEDDFGSDPLDKLPEISTERDEDNQQILDKSKFSTSHPRDIGLIPDREEFTENSEDILVSYSPAENIAINENKVHQQTAETFSNISDREFSDIQKKKNYEYFLQLLIRVTEVRESRRRLKTFLDAIPKKGFEQFQRQVSHSATHPSTSDPARIFASVVVQQLILIDQIYTALLELQNLFPNYQQNRDLETVLYFINETSEYLHDIVKLYAFCNSSLKDIADKQTFLKDVLKDWVQIVGEYKVIVERDQLAPGIVEELVALRYLLSRAKQLQSMTIDEIVKERASVFD